VDRTGVRLGYGGGCYDRALTRIRPGALVVALLHEGELLEEPLPAEDHDRRVDAVALPSGVVRLTGANSWQ
jgi:5-formyltetrahydrofolate cyclo-ligase